MKTVAKIEPEKEYENAKKILEEAGVYFFNEQMLNSLTNSIDNIMTATRVLMEREQLRRGPKKLPQQTKNKTCKVGESKKETTKLPSERYPDIEVREDVIFPHKAPKCPCCNGIMKESGLFDITEKLEVIPKRYYIQRNKRPKFNCGNCYGAIVNTPAVPSIVPSSNYGDSLVVDVTLSKYCDLIPMERYSQIASRNGLLGLPPQSLIGLTHQLADFLIQVYNKIKNEVLTSKILLADETTHKMLEGDESRHWFLWGFFSSTASYFEASDTRSGDVVFEFLKNSRAQVLVSDGYTGYDRAIKKIKKEFSREILEGDCNAHAVRYFKDASTTWQEECVPFLKIYGKIYDLEAEIKKGDKKLLQQDKLDIRSQMIPLFTELKVLCEQARGPAMKESLFLKAVNYFLNHYAGLTLCTTNPDIPLDNNHSERALRPSVVGRKTWYGTHSKRGALTMSIHFSIVGSCKAIGINPRNYYLWVVEQINQGYTALTPHEYSMLATR
jgi:transposase